MTKQPRKSFDWIQYPPAERVDQVDVYHGVEIADPYRWLEDEKSPETQDWLKAQDEIAARFFAQLPERDRVLAYLKEYWLDGVGSVPVRKGANSFFFRPAEDKPHAILYVQKGKDSPPKVVFDLNENNPDGLRTIAPVISASPEGRYVAFYIHYAGADHAGLHLYDTESGKELDEVYPPAYYTQLAWHPQEIGFFYNHLDHATLLGQESDKQPGIYWHKIGTPIEEDGLVFDQPWTHQRAAVPYTADDEEHLLIHHLHVMGSRGGWGFRRIDRDAEVTWLMDRDVACRFPYVGGAGSQVYFVTDYEAPNWRIVSLDLNNPGLENLREVVPEREEPIAMFAGTNAGNVVLHDGLLYVTYIRHNAHVIRVFDGDGNPRGEVPVPFLSQVSSIQTKKGDKQLLIGLQSFLLPPVIYAYDTESRKLTPVEEVEIPAQFGNYEMNRVFYHSKDGTRMPMTIIHRKGLEHDGSAQVLLYGYGGWGIPTLPTFNNLIPAWLHMGGVYAVANLRGGNEYGEAWHQAGQFYNKQNVFDDFCAAAEYLVREGYTTAPQIAIIGASNGGLLTAACYNQRPELFGAVISSVAAIDLLRLPDTPVGATQTMELGAPSMGKDMFEYLLSYSPLHNVRHEGPFPPILNIVGENDPRCKPGHIYKYVAELQRNGDPRRLVILRLLRGIGHGTSNKDTMMGYLADQIAFASAITQERG